jgi:hypothetical protein
LKRGDVGFVGLGRGGKLVDGLKVVEACCERMGGVDWGKHSKFWGCESRDSQYVGMQIVTEDRPMFKDSTEMGRVT